MEFQVTEVDIIANSNVLALRTGYKDAVFVGPELYTTKLNLLRFAAAMIDPYARQVPYENCSSLAVERKDKAAVSDFRLTDYISIIPMNCDFHLASLFLARQPTCLLLRSRSGLHVP